MKLKEFKIKLLQNVNFRKAYFSRRGLAFEISQMLFEARMLKGVTQNQLAKKIKTQQPSIARIENGTCLPSLTILDKIARAFNSYLIPPKFGFMVEEISNEYKSQTIDLNFNPEMRFFVPHQENYHVNNLLNINTK